MPAVLHEPLLPAGILTMVFVVLSLVHWYWVLGGRRGLEAAIPSHQGTPLFQPGRVLTALVALVLLAAAAVCLRRAGVIGLGPVWPARIATWVLAGVFAIRAIGDLQYCGLFKRVRDTAFAWNDTRIFTPLCVVIALLAAWLALVSG